MENDNLLVNLNNSSPLTIGKLALYGAEIIFIIQLLMVILNYSRDWKDEKSNSSSLETSSSSESLESSQISSSEVETDSVELLSSNDSIKKENVSSEYTVKKILTFISVLPLSSFYLILKLGYNIIKFVVYTLFDSIIYFVDHWILNFPERFEEYIISFFNNYLFRSINYINEKLILPIFSYLFNTIKTILNKIFSEENYEKAVHYISKSAEFAYDRIIVPSIKNIHIYSIKAFNSTWNFTKEYSVKTYNLAMLLLNTLTIFTLDFFEDVQVAWSGIQWFGVNIAQPAASYIEDILLTLTIRPLAYSVAFFKVLIEKTFKLLYKGCIALALLIPSFISIISVYLYKKLHLIVFRQKLHRWMCRWVYLPLWYIVYFAVNYGEKLVVDYIPRGFHAFLRFAKFVYLKLLAACNQAVIYLKIGLIRLYILGEKAFNFIVEYIPYAHKRALKLSKTIYNWLKINVFPWIDSFKHIIYDVPLNISKNAFLFMKLHIYSEDSFIGKNSRVVVNTVKRFGEDTVLYMIQGGIYIKNKTIEILKIIAPHVMDVSQKIFNVLFDLSLKIYEILKPICQKEIEILSRWIEKMLKQLGILVKDLLYELKVKISETATLIHQSIITENKKLHQSYASKKEFNKEFLYKND